MAIAQLPARLDGPDSAAAFTESYNSLSDQAPERLKYTLT